jgi:hypothetical protein
MHTTELESVYVFNQSQSNSLVAVGPTVANFKESALNGNCIFRSTIFKNADDILSTRNAILQFPPGNLMKNTVPLKEECVALKDRVFASKPADIARYA